MWRHLQWRQAECAALHHGHFEIDHITLPTSGWQLGGRSNASRALLAVATAQPSELL